MTAIATRTLKPIEVLLVDDHAIVRSGLRMLIESRSGLKIVGEAGNRAEALAVAAREQPDIILLDLDPQYTTPRRITALCCSAQWDWYLRRRLRKSS